MSLKVKSPKTVTIYKVWVHLEKIMTDKYGNEECINLDDEQLPVCIGEFTDKQTAMNTMEDMSI